MQHVFTGKMPEWSIGAVSKTVIPFGYPGFESLSFRKQNKQAFEISKACLFYNAIIALTYAFALANGAATV